MRMDNLPMFCGKCDHDWTGEVMVDVGVPESAKHMNKIKCPKCGAGASDVYLGPREAKDD